MDQPVTPEVIESPKTGVRYSPNGGYFPLADGHPNQCSATSKHSGERCKRFSIAGSHVCILHGGGAPATRNKARQRLMEAAGKVADKLLSKALDDEKDQIPCTHCGRGIPTDPNVIVKACVAVLDRAGVGPSSRLEVANDPSTLGLARLLTQEEREVVEGIFIAARERYHAQQMEG